MYSSTTEALDALAAGGIVVVLDDQAREDEADLIMAAQFATPERVAFFLHHTSGFLCAALDAERADALDLAPMVGTNTDPHRTAFTVSVDLRCATGTGISARDRSATLRALAAPDALAGDFTRPGHVMPLRARAGGVLERAGHTEAGVDLCRLAGVAPVALLCELVTPDRLDMLRGADAVAFAAAHGLPVLTTARIVEARRAERRVVRLGQARIPTPDLDLTTIAYQDPGTGAEHVALVVGDVTGDGPVPVRVHSECFTGDLLGSLRCDCGDQLRGALDHIREAGRGVVIYLRGHEGRGIGLGPKLRAYTLQQREGLDTLDANTALGLPVDGREYGAAARILADLGVDEVSLITNNPGKVDGLRDGGIAVVERLSLPVRPNEHNVGYLQTKRDRLGHLVEILDGAGASA